MTLQIVNQKQPIHQAKATKNEGRYGYKNTEQHQQNHDDHRARLTGIRPRKLFDWDCGRNIAGKKTAAFLVDGVTKPNECRHFLLFFVSLFISWTVQKVDETSTTTQKLQRR